MLQNSEQGEPAAVEAAFFVGGAWVKCATTVAKEVGVGLTRGASSRCGRAEEAPGRTLVGQRALGELRGRIETGWTRWFCLAP